MSRTYRRAYTGSKSFDATCRSHGGCPYCENERQHNDRRRQAADEKRQLRNGYLGYDPEEMDELNAILQNAFDDDEFDLYEDE